MLELEVFMGWSALALLLYLGLLHDRIVSKLSTSGIDSSVPLSPKNNHQEEKEQLEEMERNLTGFLLMFRTGFRDCGMFFLINYPCEYFYSFLSGEKEKVIIPTSPGTLWNNVSHEIFMKAFGWSLGKKELWKFWEPQKYFDN